MFNSYKPLGIATALLLSTAAPSLAQSICGAAGAGGQWIGGDAIASDISTATGPFDSTALVMASGSAVMYFSASTATDLRVEVSPQGVGDPLVEIYDASGAFVWSDDDSGGNLAARAEVSINPGQYCAVVRTFDGSPVTANLRIGTQAHPALTAGLSDTSGPATNLAACHYAISNTRISQGPLSLPVSGTYVQNNTSSIGFELTEPTALTITASNSAADPLIAIYDGNGTMIGENDDFDGLDSRVDFASPLPAGQYCISLGAFSDSSQPITVSLSTYDPNAVSLSRVNSGEASPPLDGSVTVTDLGTLSTRHRSDLQATSTAAWYSFEVTEAGALIIEAIANGAGDPALYLYDDFGRQIALNDDNGTSLDSLIAQRVTPGTYVLGVRLVNEGTQALTHLLIERFVPAR